jgi:hypothetical protein
MTSGSRPCRGRQVPAARDTWHGRIETRTLKALQVKARFRGVRTKYIFGTTLKANEVGAAIYRDFLPDALAEGRYVAAPKPSVVGHGVEDVQQAMDIQLKGVSAAKVVVTLP